MRLEPVQRTLGILLMIFSLTMLPPALLSMLVGDGAAFAFAVSFLVLLGLGGLLWIPVRRSRRELRIRDGFLIVALFWAGLGALAGLPLYLGITPGLSITDAVFEGVSGLTTTGATVLVGLDHLPLSIRYYRQQLQWLGGMGIIVLAVAILPMLGVGGFQLYRAETTGPAKDVKLTPRITETAKALWYLYLAATIACALAYWFAGMTPFDAITHAFATVSTAGFSTYDASMGHFDSDAVYLIASFFMLVGALNFALHFLAWHRRNLSPYWSDPELRFLCAVYATAILLVCGTLLAVDFYDDPARGIPRAIFQVISFATTTGFVATDVTAWPAFLPVLLIFLSFMGGMGGSTTGGIKMVRFLLLFKQGAREIVRLIHPQAQIPVKIGNKPISERVIDSIWGFFATYMAIYAIMLLLLMALGLDQVSAFSAVAATLNNLGPGLGEVAVGFMDMPVGVKWLAVVAMIMGRLEIFTLLVLLTPTFWRR